jgi:hypothetical protein
MHKSISLHKSILPLCAVTIANISSLSLASAIVAQPSNPPSTVKPSVIKKSKVVFKDPKPPSQGTPGGRPRGGASRGSCRSFENLTALVPIQNGVVWGQTSQAHPAFWFYLPSDLGGQTPIEFTLQDENDEYIYNTRQNQLKAKAGLIQLAVPATAKPLEIGKSYTWTLSVYCDPEKPSAAVFVQGTIQRVGLEAGLAKDLNRMSPIEQAELYARQGIWYETLDRIGTAYREKSDDRAIAEAWEQLLQQVKLDALKSKPISNCCQLGN